MNTKRMLPSTLALALLSATALAAPPSSEALVRAHVEKFAPAWNAHDMNALAQLFSEDADFVNVVGIWWKNRREIHAAHEATHQTMFKDSRLNARVSQVEFLRPDVAVAHLTWSLGGARAPDGTPIPERRGILVFALTREADGWTIRTAQNTDIVEGALAPPTARK